MSEDRRSRRMKHLAGQSFSGLCLADNRTIVVQL